MYPQKFSGLANTPPMGWKQLEYIPGKYQWKYGEGHGDVMVKPGHEAAGYEYIVPDDFAWMARKRDNGNLYWSAEISKAGMKALTLAYYSKGVEVCKASKTSKPVQGTPVPWVWVPSSSYYAAIGIDCLK